MPEKGAITVRVAGNERPVRVDLTSWIGTGSTAAVVKGFGCRPVVTYPVLRAGVRKPPRKEPAGPGGRSAAYGDLVGQELRRVMSWPALLTADWRPRSKIGRRCCTRRSDLGAIAGLASGSAGAGMKS